MREPTVWRQGQRPTTFGELYVGDDAQRFCFTLENAIREVPGRPVSEWKVKGETAIPAGRYRISLEHSPRFGENTITLHGVEAFDFIRVHGGMRADDTRGCPLVGNTINRDALTIHGAKLAGVLDRLKDRVAAALEDGEAWWEVRNP